MARVSRQGNGWSFTAIGTPGTALTADQLIPLAAHRPSDRPPRPYRRRHPTSLATSVPT